MILEHLARIVGAGDHALAILDLVQHVVDVVHVLVARLEEQLLALGPAQVAVLVLIEDLENFNHFVQQVLLVESPSSYKGYWEMRIRN